MKCTPSDRKKIVNKRPTLNNPFIWDGLKTRKPPEHKIQRAHTRTQDGFLTRKIVIKKLQEPNGNFTTYPAFEIKIITKIVIKTVIRQ